MVDQDGLVFAVSRQVSPQQKGETVLKCLEAWGRLLLPNDVRAVRHFFPLQARFIHIKNLLELKQEHLLLCLSEYAPFFLVYRRLFLCSYYQFQRSHSHTHLQTHG